MPDILLINPPLSRSARYGEFAGVGNELPNLGLLYLAAYMRRQGATVAVVDAPALAMDVSGVVETIRKSSPRIVGFTAVTMALSSAVACAVAAKKEFPQTPIVLGGPHITALPIQTMNEHPGIDFGVFGEGEQTFWELYCAIEKGHESGGINGLIFRQGEKVVQNPPRPLITDLDSLPIPAWDLLPDLAETYRPSPQSTFRLPSTILFTTRGCPYRCTFCDRAVFGNRVRSHSAGRVVEIMNHLHDTYGIVDFAFHDESFIYNEKRLVEICTLLIDQKRPFSWYCQGRVDQKISDETLALMKRAGCRQLQFGVESANDSILQTMGKGITVNQVSEALAQAHNAGISNKAFFIVGLFGESEKTLANTERFILEAPLDDILINFFTPFPGCEAYDQVEQYGKLSGGFDEMTEYRVAFIPDGLDAKRLVEARARMYRRFYLRPRIVKNYMKRLGEPSTRGSLVRSAFSALRSLLFRKGD